MRFEIKGVDDIAKKLEALGKTGTKKVMRKAMREAMKPMLAEVKADLPSVTGGQKREVKLRAIKRNRSSFGVKIELADPQGKLGALPTEYGWKAGKAQREIEGQGNIRKAFEITKHAAATSAEQGIMDGISEELK